MDGFAASTTPYVLVLPSDDDFDAGFIGRIVELSRQGCDTVCASRMPGDTMQGCPWLKAALLRTAAFALHYLARLPTRDTSSGFCLFSRRVIDRIAIESDEGFCYIIGLLVKAQRLGLRTGEVPALRLERQQGTSRFRVLNGSWRISAGFLCLRHDLATAPAETGHSQSLSLCGAHPMVEEWPKIRSRRTTKISPWMNVIAREVEFAPGEPPQIYHAVGQLDYLAIVARTLDGRVPIVRQYRPAFEAFTWELPAGLIQRGVRAAGFIPEPGITLGLKTPAELAAMITANEFVQQLHLGALLLADLRRFMTLPR